MDYGRTRVKDQQVTEAVHQIEWESYQTKRIGIDYDELNDYKTIALTSLINPKKCVGVDECPIIQQELLYGVIILFELNYCYIGIEINQVPTSPPGLFVYI